MSEANPNVTITPLGGLGEIGKNCMLLETDSSLVMIDCGLMFPEDSLFGVDVVIPDFDYVLHRKDKLAAIVLTHGHEDHIGGLPWLLPYVDAPVYGSRFTLGLVENKLVEHNLADHVELRPMAKNERFRAGDFAFTPIQVCHSIIQGFGLGIETPVGRIIHSGDFKIDRNPMHGQRTDLEAFARFAEPGVKLLFSDSTNVERDGYALTEFEISETFKEIFAKATGRIMITLFSSHIQRIQEILDISAEFGRKVAVSGKSMLRNIELAAQMGFLRVPKKTLIDAEAASEHPDNILTLLVTGSQGEPLAALSRISLEEHRQITVHEGDLVIMSSRFIPANVKAIYKVINRLYKLGAEVLYDRVGAIHASGHAHGAELSRMIETVSPEHFVPVHGEYRHLVKHARLARTLGVAEDKALVVEDGERMVLYEDGYEFLSPIRAEDVLVDGKGVGDVGVSVLKERRLLAGEGMVIVLVIIDQATGEIVVGPDITSKGFVFEQNFSHLLEDAKCIVLDIFENIPPGQTVKLAERIRSSLRRFFRKVLDRDPVVVPIVESV